MYEERLYPFCIALFLLCFDLFLSKCRMKASDFSEFGSHSSMQAGQILGNAGYTPVLMNFANESFGKMGGWMPFLCTGSSFGMDNCLYHTSQIFTGDV